MKKVMRFAIGLFIIVLFSLQMTVFVFAQDETPTPSREDGIPVDIVEDSELFLQDLLEGLSTLVYLPFAATLVVALTAVSKKVLTSTEPTLQSLAWSIVVWVMYIIAARAGFAEQFETLVPAFATAVATFAGISLTPVASGAMYRQLNNENVPFLGTRQHQSLSD